MEKNGGMVAVVQGLQDSNLTVTLLDGGKQYTLMPNNHAQQPRPGQVHGQRSVNCASQYTTEKCSGFTNGGNRENGIQATDGRYASTYKMVHCHLTPTSPPITVTEFPPQRPDVVQGHGNFVIGGCGSGETGRPAAKTSSFRGGMVWPDKGSVCASRASMQSDAFANSLRKYPNITPERSSEIVERLISFTQAKNMSKQNRCPGSPTRNSVDSESSKQTFILERNSSKNSFMGKVIYHPEVNVDSKRNRLNEISPERDRSYNLLSDNNDDSWNRPMFCKNNDVRCFRDTARRVKEGFRHRAVPPTNQIDKPTSSIIRGEYDCEMYTRRMHEQESNNSVNMEIQAAAQMESKEILTLPRIVPMQRTIATSLSPIPSRIEARIENGLNSEFSFSTELIHACSCKSIQVKLPLDSNIKIISSSFDLRTIKYRNKNKSSKSDEELGNFKKLKPDSISSLLHQFNDKSEVNEIFSQVKGPMIKHKRICQNCRHLYNDFDILRRSVSNNTYFHEDNQCNINEQQTSKHFIMSKHCIIESNQVNKDTYGEQHRLPEFLSYIDSDNNIKVSETDIKKVSNLTKPNNEPKSIQYNSDSVDFTNKFMDEERCHGKIKSRLRESNKNYRKHFGDEVYQNNKGLAMSQQVIRNLIDLDILAFTEKYRINITTENLNALIEELFDLFVMNLKNSSLPNKQNMIENIKTVLHSRGLSEFQSVCLTNILTEHWAEQFLTTSYASNFKSNTLIVLSNLIQESSHYERDDRDTNDFSINEISQKDIDANIKLYMSQISNEINEWLSNIQLPETLDEDARQPIINDLATDIVDRHKYLELNPSNEKSETIELEHLKYQIFKLIYKLGISHMTLVDHAIDLMKRIQSVAVPIFSMEERKETGTGNMFESIAEPEKPSQGLKEELSNVGASTSRYLGPGNKCCKRPTCKRNLNNKSVPKFSSGRSTSLREPERISQATGSTRRISSPGKPTSLNTDTNKVGGSTQSETNETNVPFNQRQNFTNNIPYNRSALFSGGIKIRDEESDNNIIQNNIQTEPYEVSAINKSYSQYLKEWVEKIPLPMTSTEDQKVARTDIYNGILKAVSKLKSERDTFSNRFLFEDKLDDEIEKLIDNLPQSPELSLKKHIFKVKLIEKTSNTNDLVKSLNSYKHQLVENLKENLPKPTLSECENPDILEIYEELQTLNLVEDFIIYSHYENQDPVIAEAYRKKLLKHTEGFVEELKANHNKALKNIDSKLYIKEILDMLKNVPLPSNETIQAEADEILLSLEIDKWFSDLPLNQNNDYVELLHRRRLRNNLAKQILDREKDAGNRTNILDNSLKHEISQFLGKAPLQQGESLNINFMVDELIKRLKNRPNLLGNESKKVVFNEPDYNEFCKNMPLCSTYTGHPDENIELEISNTQGSKLVQDNDQNQRLHSGYYHNISKPLIDDLKADQIGGDTGLSLQEIPNYESFDNTRPRSSSIKDNIEPHWYTLQESRRGHKESKISLNKVKNQHIKEQSNKSVQAISPSQQSHSRHYHNIAQPLLDDLRLDSHCCKDSLTENDTFNGVRPRTSLPNGGSQTNWYTIQESKQELSNSQQPQHLNDLDHFNQGQQYNMPEHDFTVPQQLKKSYETRRIPRENSFKDTPTETQDEDAGRHNNNHMVRQRWANSHSPVNVSPRRRESQKINHRNIRGEVASPQRTTYHPTSSNEPNRDISNRSSRCQNTIEQQRSASSQLNRPDSFYRSTDQEDIRQTIERDKSMDANLDRHNSPENLPGYYQPSVLIPTCYVPLRMGTKKGGCMTDRNIDEELCEEEDSEDNDEEDEIPCRCMEKMWKNKKRYRYCPFEQYDGFPMCLTSPYFYPYFY